MKALIEKFTLLTFTLAAMAVTTLAQTPQATPPPPQFNCKFTSIY